MTGYYGMNIKMTNIEGDYGRFMFATTHPDELGELKIKKKFRRKEKLKEKSKLFILMEVRWKYNDYEAFT